MTVLKFNWTFKILSSPDMMPPVATPPRKNISVTCFKYSLSHTKFHSDIQVLPKLSDISNSHSVHLKRSVVFWTSASFHKSNSEKTCFRVFVVQIKIGIECILYNDDIENESKRIIMQLALPAYVCLKPGSNCDLLCGSCLAIGWYFAIHCDRCDSDQLDAYTKIVYRLPSNGEKEKKTDKEIVGMEFKLGMSHCYLCRWYSKKFYTSKKKKIRKPMLKF